ncbi:MAG: hypothetical protein K8S21_06140 [Gemmatimonadetes bacterium]|nr:hypothetical protein [Gemmatimonadota bacterium]
MRTTVDIDPDLLERVRSDSMRSGRSFREELNRVIHRGLSMSGARVTEPYLTPTFALGPVPEGIDLDKALALASVLADQESVRKLQRRK